MKVIVEIPDDVLSEMIDDKVVYPIEHIVVEVSCERMCGYEFHQKMFKYPLIELERVK